MRVFSGGAGFCGFGTDNTNISRFYFIYFCWFRAVAKLMDDWFIRKEKRTIVQGS